MSSLSADGAEEARRAHLELLRNAIGATGGTEVKNLGDGLMVVFPSTNRTLACAVAMQRAADRHNARSDVTFSIRIGMSCGEVTEEDGDYFGDPVVEAAR